jgi:hypothetical protein
MLRGRFLTKHFDARYLREARQGLDFLLRTRNEMHLQAHALHDTLEFNLQRQVAKSLKYRDSLSLTSVERFMKDYYVAARVVSQLARRIMNWAHDQYVATAEHNVMLRLASPFVVKDKKLDLSIVRDRLTSEETLRAFLLSIDHNMPFSHRLEDALARNASRRSPLRAEGETLAFSSGGFRNGKASLPSSSITNTTSILRMSIRLSSCPTPKPFPRALRHSGISFDHCRDTTPFTSQPCATTSPSQSA